MKSLNNKGFMLAETLVVSTFLIVTLLFLYVQFNNVKKSYDVSFRYNQVDGLYGVKNIEKYIKTDGMTSLTSAIAGKTHIDITTCPSANFIEVNYCKKLFESLDVKTVLFTNENLTSLRDSNMPFSQTLQDYIKSIKYDKIAGYRIIVEYNNDTFASLRVVS